MFRFGERGGSAGGTNLIYSAGSSQRCMHCSVSVRGKTRPQTGVQRELNAIRPGAHAMQLVSEVAATKRHTAVPRSAIASRATDIEYLNQQWDCTYRFFGLPVYTFDANHVNLPSTSSGVRSSAFSIVSFGSPRTSGLASFFL